MTSEQSTTARALSDALAAAVERAAASTVLVAARRHIPASGVVWTDDGLIVTADHAVESEDDITVGLPDGRDLQAHLVGRDPGSDLALLRIDDGGLPPIERASAGSAKVGHLALAVARPTRSGPQASLGAISAIASSEGDRPAGRRRRALPVRIDGYLRSDVTFFPGFSGGPLVDAEGRALGINVSLIAGPRMFRFARAAFGQGLTVDAASVSRTVDLLRTHGRVRRAYLGIASQPVTVPDAVTADLGGQTEGLLIVSVEANTPASGAGVLVGDILVGMEGAPIRDAADLQLALSPERVGATVALQLIRGGARHELSVTLGARD